MNYIETDEHPGEPPDFHSKSDAESPSDPDYFESARTNPINGNYININSPTLHIASSVSHKKVFER